MTGRTSASVAGGADSLALARGGDVHAFGELYRQYLPDVRAYCARRIGDRIRAEDIAQETFVKAFKRIRSFQPGAAFWPWISTIAKNLCIDELRQCRRTREEDRAEPPEPREPLNLHVDSTADEVVRCHGRADLRVTMMEALETLDVRERQLLWSHVVEEQSYEEIARSSGMSIQAARQVAWRARTSMRLLLEQVGRDVRDYCLAPVFALSAMLRRIRDRAQRLLAPEGAEARLALFERGTAAIFGLTLASAAWVVGSSESPRLGREGAEQRIERSASPRAVGPRPSSAGPHQLESGSRNSPNSQLPVNVSAKTKKRKDAGAPASTYYRIEIRDPSGNVIYGRESQLNCGDGRHSQILPEPSPVRAYC